MFYHPDVNKRLYACRIIQHVDYRAFYLIEVYFYHFCYEEVTTYIHVHTLHVLYIY